MARILVVDDNETNRKLVSATLRFEGHEPAEALDGFDGLTCARESRPDLIISDILMPSMDGYEFVRKLREEVGLREVPVIFYTAYYHEAKARELADACNVSSVLVKPCSSADLLAAVDRALHRRQAPAPRLAQDDFDRDHLRVMTDLLAEQAAALSVAKSRLEALTQLNVQLASERDPRLLLEQVCQGARKLIGSRFAVAVAAGRSGAEAAIFAASGLEGGAANLPIPDIHAGLLGKVVAERQAVRLSKTAGERLEAVLPPGYPAGHALLAAPIMSLKQAFGWICLFDKLGEAGFDAEDEHILAILGAQSGRVFENGSLYRQVQQHAMQLQVEMDRRERSAVLLRESEERFRQLAENIRDVFFMFSGDFSRILYISPAYEAVWGQPRGNLRERPLPWLDAVHPDDRERCRRDTGDLGGAVANGLQLEFRILPPNAEMRWVQVRTFPVYSHVDDDRRIVGVATDITARKLAEAKIDHLSRVHAMLSGINSLIVRVGERGELLGEACRLAVQQGRFRMAWCSWLDPDSHELSPVAWAGEAAELVQTARCDLEDPAAAGSRVGTAMRTRLPVFANQLQGDVTSLAFEQQLQQRGINAMAVLPLVTDDTAVGCLTLVTDEVDFFTEAEIRLLTELSADIAFALDHIDKSERINYLAYYDSLTGLANRALFRERLSQQVETMSRTGRTFALIVAEPERLGSVNDSYGRHAADELIRQLAVRLTSCVGNASEVARIGTEQFGILVLDARDETEIVLRVEQLWKDWLGTSFSMAGHELRVAARAGVALCPTDGDDPDLLVEHAEAALKNARVANERFQFYTVQLSERAADTLSLETELRHALEREEFELHYQPKVDTDARALQGLEALIRWRHPRRGLICPLQFVPLLEETGMIVEVGAWVMRQACIDRSRWREAKLNAPRIAVNVSTVQLRRADFVRSVGNVVKLAGGAADLDIEVTESVIIDDAAQNIQKLHALRELGIRIAIDDFGTGYSSLGYLTRLPAEILKIDRSFISSMLEDPGAMTLVSTIISLGRSLNMTVVAEGVELEEQAKILRLLRCNQMQGYLISRPLSFEEMTGYLGRPRA